MAKQTHCAFCGKELTTGFFSGDATSILIGTHTVICCEHCLEQYSQKIQTHKNRLKIKLNNYQRATKTRKLDSDFIGTAIMRYLAEEEEQIARCGKISQYTDLGYFAVEESKGFFAVREFELGGETTGEMIRNMKKAEDVGDVWFSKDDITCMEYATTTFGHSLSLFSSAFTFEIRLNNEKDITYKPCITRATFKGTGLFPHNHRKDAQRQCAAMLILLKDAIGADVPVVSVKRPVTI